MEDVELLADALPGGCSGTQLIDSTWCLIRDQQTEVVPVIHSGPAAS